MAIEKMRLIRLAGSKENIEKILLTTFSSDDLHAELGSHVVNEGNGGVLMVEDSTYADYLNRIDNIYDSLHLGLESNYDGVSEFSIEEIEHQLSLAEKQYEKINEQHISQSTLNKEDIDAMIALRQYNIAALNELTYTAVTFGRLPLSSQSKLNLLEEKGFVYTTLHKNNHYVWIFIVSSKEDQKLTNTLLESLYFEVIPIPKFDEEQLVFDCESALGKIYGFVKHNAEVRKYYKYMALFDETCVITGFVPKAKVKRFKTMFGEMTDVVIQDFPAESEEGLEPPTVLKNGWFARPFELFIDMYGLPHYGDFDPTLYFSITYSILFGIMFGDLGQGMLLVAIGSLLVWKKKMGQLAAVIIRLGLFSMIFGFVYGSFFGEEKVLDFIYTDYLGMAGKPIEVLDSANTQMLLLSAVGIGAFLILSSILLNIINRFRKKDFAEALFSQNGLAGFIFYGTVIAVAVCQMMLGIQALNLITELIMIIPLITILFRVPLKNLMRKISVKPHEGWGGYLTESFFELFEVILSFVTNTMSFLRVGGFVLSHAGMMFVVITLKELVGMYGIVVLIFGNIFVIGLEGLIVGIQTLRLEYYEMFSRYFEGGGKKYVPTTTLNH